MKINYQYWAIILFVMVVTVVDALRIPRERWEQCGYWKTPWVILLILLQPFSGIVYVVRVQPRLLARP